MTDHINRAYDSAFPTDFQHEDSNNMHRCGLSVKEYFAIKIYASMYSGKEPALVTSSNAKLAVEMAELLLEVLYPTKKT